MKKEALEHAIQVLAIIGAVCLIGWFVTLMAFFGFIVWTAVGHSFTALYGAFKILAPDL